MIKIKSKIIAEVNDKWDEDEEAFFFKNGLLEKDVKEGNNNGLDLCNDRYLKGFYNDEFTLDYKQLTSEQINLLKKSKINDLLEIDLCLETYYDPNYVNDNLTEEEENRYFSINEHEKKVFQLNKVKDPQIVSNYHNLIKNQRMKELYLFRDTRYKQKYGQSLIGTKNEIMLTEATPYDIGVYNECDLYKKYGFITIDNILDHNPNSEDEVRKSFENLEKLGYLRKDKRDIEPEDEDSRQYIFYESIFEDKFSDVEKLYAKDKIYYGCNYKLYEREIIDDICRLGNDEPIVERWNLFY